MIDEELHQAWDKVSYEARRGNNKPLAHFLREHEDLYRDIDLPKLGQLLDGGFPTRQRGPRSKTVKEARAKDPFLRADDGDPRMLVSMLEEHYYQCSIPDLQIVVDALLGRWSRSPGPDPGHKIAQGLNAWRIVELVREVRLRQANAGRLLPLDEAFHLVGQEVNKSFEWVRAEYYKMYRHSSETAGDHEPESISGVDWLDDGDGTEGPTNSE